MGLVIEAQERRDPKVHRIQTSASAVEYFCGSCSSVEMATEFFF